MVLYRNIPGIHTVISTGALAETEFTAVTANVYLTPPSKPSRVHTVETVLTCTVDSVPVTFVDAEQTYSFTDREYKASTLPCYADAHMHA